MIHDFTDTRQSPIHSALRPMRELPRYFAMLTCGLILAGCSDITNTQGTFDSENEGYGYVTVDEDPLESVNRASFQAHTFIDKALIRPVAKAYNVVVPEEGRNIVSNILENLSAPVTLVNSVLQGDAENSFATFWRIMLNSTFGVAGAFDFAGDAVGLTARDADFGQTLASFGVNSGPYLFVPVIGPTTVRDGAGFMFDTLFRPVTWVDGDTWSIVEAGALGIDFRADNMRAIDDLNNNSLDPYSAYRSAYLQRRTIEIQVPKDSWWSW